MVTKPELIRQVAQKDQHIRQLLDIVEKLSEEPKTETEPINQFGSSTVVRSLEDPGYASSPTPLEVSWGETTEPEEDDFEEELDLEDLIGSLFVPYGDEASVAVGAVVLMLENKIDFLPVKTGADLGTYAEQAEEIHKLRSWLAFGLLSSDGTELTDVAETAFWAEATELYESLTS